MRDETTIEVLSRIQMEFMEMPGLKLTASQARRLCNLPEDVCQGALDALTRTGFLRQLRDGSFLRPGLSAAPRRAVLA